MSGGHRFWNRTYVRGITISASVFSTFTVFWQCLLNLSRLTTTNRNSDRSRQNFSYSVFQSFVCHGVLKIEIWSIAHWNGILPQEHRCDRDLGLTMIEKKLTNIMAVRNNVGTLNNERLDNVTPIVDPISENWICFIEHIKVGQSIKTQLNS